MRDLGELWRAIQNTPDRNFAYQRRILVNGDPYYDNELFDIKKSNGLIDSASNPLSIIGKAISGRLDVTFIPHEGITIPPQAKVQYQIRMLYLGTMEFREAGGRKFITSDGYQFAVKPIIHIPFFDADGKPLIDKNRKQINVLSYIYTEWVDFGTFFIDYRTKIENKLKIECYDAIIRSHDEFLAVHGIIDNYPMPASQMLSYIAKYIDVKIDARTIIRPDVMVQYPNKLTMHEILSFIASAHGGNFTITDDNELRLVVVKNHAPLFNIRKRDIKRKTTSDPREFTKLRMVHTDEGDYYEAGYGDYVIEVINLFATQEMTNKVQEIVSTYRYNTFEITEADIDPALELGDSINVDGMQGNIWTLSYGNMLFADISAPTQGDTAREFPFRGTISNSLGRRMSTLNGRVTDLTIDFEGFKFIVSDYQNDNLQRFSALNVTIDSINLTVSDNYNSLSSMIVQKVDSLALSVTNYGTSSTVTLTSGGINLSSANINITGFVTFASLSGSGTTTINGSNITTGTINASLVNVTNLQINNVLYGTYQVITASGSYSYPTIQIGQGVSQAAQVNIASQNLDISSPNMTIGRQGQTYLTMYGSNFTFEGGTISLNNTYSANISQYSTYIGGSISIGGTAYGVMSKIGFFGNPPIDRPTTWGSRPNGNVSYIETLLLQLITHLGTNYLGLINYTIY